MVTFTLICTFTSFADDTIKIASFNIQVFGQSKSSKPEVMEILADIIRGFDIVAIQEVRDKPGTAIVRLLNTVNSNGSKYDYIIGPWKPFGFS